MIFAIGNSLTLDTYPTQWADGWHIDSNRTPDFIFNNPDQVEIGTRWDTEFATNTYDIVTVQPLKSGENPALQTDINAISEFVALMPDAKFIIHTGWALYAEHEIDYYSTDISGLLLQTPLYFEALIAALRVAYPATEFQINPAINVLENINQDIQKGIGPLTALSDLYRDVLHMNDPGRYLMRGVMLRTLGLPSSDANSSTFSWEIKRYLDYKILEVIPMGFLVTEAKPAGEVD